jgi:tetratricopeptide (TPR) repeat protein
MLGEADEARRLAAQGRSIYAELAMTDLLAAETMETAWMPLRAGDPAGAEEELRPAYETLLASGNRGALCCVAAVLAEALYQQGHCDEAHRLTEESENAAASDDILAQVWWRSVRAKVLARRGDVEQSERLAREAVALSDPTDWIPVKASALLDLAEVLRLTGKPTEAVEPLERALALCEAKGDVVGARRARSSLAELREARP